MEIPLHIHYIFLDPLCPVNVILYYEENSLLPLQDANSIVLCISREEARDMFYHAYNAYMVSFYFLSVDCAIFLYLSVNKYFTLQENAYPADELMPLSCKGRWRGKESSRGDIDDTLGK